MAEASVVYRAIADFVELRKQIKAVRRDIRELKAEEAALNVGQVKGSGGSVGSQDTAKFVQNLTRAFTENTKVAAQNSTALDRVVRSTRQDISVITAQGKALDRVHGALVAQGRELERVRSSEVGHTTDLTVQAKAINSVQGALVTQSKELERARSSEVSYINQTGKSVVVHQDVDRALASNQHSYTQLVAVRRVAEESSRSLARTEEKSNADIVRSTQDVVRAQSRALAIPHVNLPGGGGSGGGGSSDPDPGGRGDASAKRLEGSLGRLGRAFGKIFAIVLLVGSALGPAIAALGALGSAALGVVGGLGQATGAMLAIPAGVAVAVLSIGTLALALKGITKVFQAYSRMQKTAPADAKAAAKAQAAAARQVADAQRALARARLDAARSAKDAAAQVADAERALAKAQKGVLKAQLDLNQARKAALQDLQDLRAEVARGGLNEESAVAALAKAQEEYNKVEADATSTSADRLEALSRLHNAEQDLADVRTKRARDSKDLAEAEKKGIEGSDKVVAAKDNQVNAEENLADAKRTLKKAEVDQARSAVDSAQRISDAQRNLADAHAAVKDAQTKTSAGANAFNAALKALSPNAQKFVLGLIAMKDQFKAIKMAVQDAFFGPLIGQLGNIKGALQPIKENLTLVAGALGDVTAKFIEWLTSPAMRPFFKTLATETAKIIEIIGPALINVFQAFSDIIIAGLPYIEKFATWIATLADHFKNWASDTDHLNGVLKTGTDRLGDFGAILGNLAGAFKNLMDAAAPFIDWIMNGLVTGTQNFQDFTDAQKMPNSPFKKYLEDIKPLLHEIGQDLKTFIGYLFGQAADPKNIKQALDILQKLRNELGPALAKLFDTIRDKDIIPKFVDALTSMVNVLQKIIDKTEGISTFFTVLGKMFDSISWIIDNVPGVGLAITGLTVALGGLFALKAAAFLSKMAGVTKLFKFLGGTKLAKIIAGNAKILGGALLPGKSGLKGLGTGLLKKGAKGGGLAGLAGGIVGSVVGDKINDHRGGAREVGGRSLKGAATGAGLGASIGAVAGVGVFSWLTAPIGAAIGAILGVIVANWKPIKDFFVNTAFPALTKAFKKTWDAITSVTSKVWSVITSVVSGAWGGIKKIFTTSFDFIQGVVSKGWDVITTIWNAVWPIISLPMKIFLGLLGLLFLGAFAVVKLVVSTAWTVIKATFTAAYVVIRTGVSGFLTAVKAIFTAIWGAVGPYVKAVWEIIKTAFSAAFTVIKTATSVAWGVIKTTFSTVFNAIKTAIDVVWTGIKKAWDAAFGVIKATASTVWGAISGIFSTGIEAIRKILAGASSIFDKAWSGVKKVFSVPIKFVADKIINPFIDGINKGLKVFNVTQIGTIDTSGFASGGTVPGTGSRDTVPAMLTPGEVVIRKQSVEQIGIRKLLYMNETGRIPGYNRGGAVRTGERRSDGRMGFVGGGVATGFPNPINIAKSAGSKLKSGVSAGWDLAKDLGKDALDKMRQFGVMAVLGPYIAAAKLALKVPLADGAMGMPKKAAGKFIDSAYDFLKGTDAKQMAAGGATGAGTGEPNHRALPSVGGPSDGPIYGPNIPTNAGGKKAKGFAQAQVGKPYIWGGVGPKGYDCSGFMSAIENVIQGKNPYTRRFATSSFAGGPISGWRYGTSGNFSIGVMQAGQNGHSVGHTAGTLNGMNVESRGGRGVLTGSAARGATNPLFTRRFSLNGYAKGGVVGDAPFDVIDPKGKAWKSTTNSAGGPLAGAPTPGSISRYARGGSVPRPRALATGGLVPARAPACVALDSGGLIPAGLNGGGLIHAGMPLSGYSGGVTSVSNATTNSTQSRGGMTVEQMVINNPVPERASDSIPRTIRKMSYLNSAGTN